MEERKYRLYGLVPYQLMGMQQGIQFMHASIEYANEFGDTGPYYRWSRYDKTVIVLNGGTTNNNPDKPGTLNKHLESLIAKDIKVAKFWEEDLGDQLTAVVFLVDDRVWDKETWPDYKMSYEEQERYKRMTRNASLEDIPAILENFESYRIWFNKFSDKYSEAEKIVWLREFLSPRNFKLA